MSSIKGVKQPQPIVKYFCFGLIYLLRQVITSAEFHPTHCNMLAYSSSKGTIRLIDMRQSALCDRHAKLFEEQDASGSRSFFTEIIASISDIKFGKDGRHILSRDYMTLKPPPFVTAAVRQTQMPSWPSRSLATLARGRRRGGESLAIDSTGGAYDFSTKLLHLAWHPTSNALACAASNSLYMYYAEDSAENGTKH
ncbi:hypothetical protein ACLOJK_003034 [Asimina triloba]